MTNGIDMVMAVEHLFLWFVFYSFVGWVYESTLVSIQQRRWIDRGFLNGPLCPIYGTGAVMGITLLDGIGNPVTLFFAAAIGASALEYATSWVMEWLFHARWWDYSNFRFNLNGRVCLLGAAIFGLGGVVLVGFAHPIVAAWTERIPDWAVHWIAAILLVAIIVDTAITVAGILHFEDRLTAFADRIQEYAAKAGDSWQWGTDSLSERVHGWSESSQRILARVRASATSMLNKQQRRMITSFPHLRLLSERYNSIVETLRELFRQGK